MRLWNDHRNFILAVLGGLLLFLAVETWALGVLARAADAREGSADFASAIEDQGIQVRDAEVLEEGRKLALRERVLPQHRARFELAVPAGYVLPDGDPNPLFRLRKALENASASLRELARPRDVKLPKDLGFAADLRDTDAAEGLLRLAVAEELVRRAIDAGMAGVDEVRQAESSLLPAGGGQALLVLRVKVVMRGDWAATTRCLSSLSERAPFLALLDADLRDEDGAVRAELTLAALRIVDAAAAGKGGIPKAGANEGKAGSGDPAGPKPIRTYRPR